MTTTDTHKRAAEAVCDTPYMRHWYATPSQREEIQEEIADILAKHLPSQPPTADAEELAGKLIERVLEHTSGGRTYLRTSLMDEFTPLLAPLVAENAELKAKEEESANVIIQFMQRLQAYEDQLDLNRDEFQRIKAIANNPEIVGLCSRSQSRITQNVSVIAQRDAAQTQLAKARGVVEECRKAFQDEKDWNDHEVAYEEMVERAEAEGWINDPTGSCHIGDAANAKGKAHRKAVASYAKALAAATEFLKSLAS